MDHSTHTRVEGQCRNPAPRFTGTRRGPGPSRDPAVPARGNAEGRNRIDEDEFAEGEAAEAAAAAAPAPSPTGDLVDRLGGAAPAALPGEDRDFEEESVLEPVFR